MVIPIFVVSIPEVEAGGLKVLLEKKNKKTQGPEDVDNAVKVRHILCETHGKVVWHEIQ